jgi:hypothetical protein
MRIIKIHQADGRPAYVNVEQITAICEDTDAAYGRLTMICLTSSGVIRTRSLPEEVLLRLADPTQNAVIPTT